MANQLRKEDLYVPFDKTDLNKLVDYVSGANPIYIGYAQPGSATSAAVWQICKMTYDGSNHVIAVQWTSGSNLYDKVWDNRASYSYS